MRVTRRRLEKVEAQVRARRPADADAVGFDWASLYAFQAGEIPLEKLPPSIRSLLVDEATIQAREPADPVAERISEIENAGAPRQH
jgi:hypothetical protein